jgi:hypothetical protein
MLTVFQFVIETIEPSDLEERQAVEPQAAAAPTGLPEAAHGVERSRWAGQSVPGRVQIRQRVAL